MTALSIRELHENRERAGYDEREHWLTFTRRLSRLPGVDEMSRELAWYAVWISGATCGAVYLAEAGAAVYRLGAAIGSVRFAPMIDQTSVPSRLRAAASPVDLPASFLPSLTMPALPAALAVPLRWRATPIGIIVLGPQRAGADYSVEDVEFLAAVADQVAASITAVRHSGTQGQATAVIHDIKNSISTLSLLARNAPGNLADPEFQRDAVATLSHTVERMRRLLVKLSSPEAETSASRMEPIDLQALIIEATAPLAANHKVRLVRQLRPVDAIYGDRDALLRVVENLTTNAAEAIDHEGTVTVTLVQDQGHAIISVADTGCGISEDYRERHLFSPFCSTKKGGWGIGLYQTKQVIESQDGEILVDSAVGQGTTFTVKLPLRADVETSLEIVR
jgi:putative PEP-CTERM system histidine kinase